MDLLLIDAAGQLKKEQVKDEIAKYVQALETNYTNIIRTLKEKNERLQRQVKLVRSERMNEASDKSDIETLFIECIEEVRKEVMRRRFRTEVANRKATRLVAQRSNTSGNIASPASGTL